MTIKEYAMSRGVSYEAVRRQVTELKKKELKKHIRVNGRQQILDDYAIEVLDQHRQPREVVVVASNDDTQKELERLHNQVHQLQLELQKKTEKINVLLEEKVLLVEDKARNDTLLLLADKEHDELEQVKQELASYQRTIFGLYKKVPRQQDNQQETQ